MHACLSMACMDRVRLPCVHLVGHDLKVLLRRDWMKGKLP